VDEVLKTSKAKVGVVQQNRYNESANWHGRLAKEGGGVIINQALAKKSI
jgi:hypothetical protein